jgi:two-component system, OmpR family, sensor histidine kinase SaeS
VITLSLAVVASTLAVGAIVAVVLRALPSVRLQLAGLALVAVLLPLGAVLASGWVMFHMGDDVKILAVASASALAAVVVALVLAWPVAARLADLERTAKRIAAGDLGARAREGGPREVAAVARTANEMATSLERLFDARRELVAWASHDLRTPIAAMQAMLEAIEDGLADPRAYVPALQEQVRALAMLVDDLFELARIDAGALTLELRTSELRSLVDACLLALAPEADARRVRLEARGDGTALCAPEKVERVLYNLVTNSLRHTPADGAVAVLVQPGAAEVVVAVEDTGEGLDGGTQERMFERFWRREPSRPRGGAGLGLAIARGLVEAQGGRIWAENRPTGGARVCFTLPTAA